MKPKAFRKECKSAYLLMRRRHKKAGFQTKEYLRLLYENMLWEGKIEASNNCFNLMRFAHKLSKC